MFVFHWALRGIFDLVVGACSSSRKEGGAAIADPHGAPRLPSRGRSWYDSTIELVEGLSSEVYRTGLGGIQELAEVLLCDAPAHSVSLQHESLSLQNSRGDRSNMLVWCATQEGWMMREDPRPVRRQQKLAAVATTGAV